MIGITFEFRLTRRGDATQLRVAGADMTANPPRRDLATSIGLVHQDAVVQHVCDDVVVL